VTGGNGERIRPIALAAIRRDDTLLAFEMTDPTRDVTFCRPLGGGIEFGERAEQAVRRELLEEIGAELVNVRLLGVLENLFHGFDRDGHEIAFIFAADFADESLYRRESFVCTDDGSPVGWHPLARFAGGAVPLFPSGLLQLLP
jgi:8-oxo-dGTP pyrophosphatase MutT (NUDIX family)